MALPGTPGGGQQISMSQINTELGRSATAEISLDSAENGSYATINTCSQYYPSSSNPATMNEWHGYNHSAACLYAFTMYYYNTGDGYYGGTSATQACAATYTYTVYGTTSTIQTGTRLYYNSNSTGEVEGSNNTSYYWFKIDGYSFSYTQGSGNGVANLASCSSGTDYYHYYVDSYGCTSCNTISGPANGLVASVSSLSTGYYYFDNNTGNVYYLTSYYGFGQYAGQIINASGPFSSCAAGCAS